VKNLWLEAGMPWLHLYDVIRVTEGLSFKDDGIS
jgi:hypothetical protein